MASPYTFQGQQQQQWFGKGEEEEQEEEEMSGQVHKIVSRVCKGEVFIIPAGHPVVTVAQDQNLVAVGVGINASTSTRTFLAGQENMLRNLDKVATRLTFGVGSKVTKRNKLEKQVEKEEEDFSKLVLVRSIERSIREMERNREEKDREIVITLKGRGLRINV